MAGKYTEDVIFRIAFAAMFLLLPLHYEKIGGNPVPTVIFKRRPALFHVFLMSLAFAFSGAFVTMSFRERHPKFAGCCRWLALCSATTAAGVLTMSVLLPSSPISR